VCGTRRVPSSTISGQLAAEDRDGAGEDEAWWRLLRAATGQQGQQPLHVDREAMAEIGLRL
jgi:hypothetical protein